MSKFCGVTDIVGIKLVGFHSTSINAKKRINRSILNQNQYIGTLFWLYLYIFCSQSGRDLSMHG